MREAAEPEESAAEEKRVELKSGERNAEKMGSAENESRTEGEGVRGGGVEVERLGVPPVGDGIGASLKVERRCRGVLWMAGEAISDLQ